MKQGKWQTQGLENADSLNTRFEERQVLYERAVRKVRLAIEDYAADQSIPLAAVESRIKSLDSIRRKMHQRRIDEDEIFNKIVDIAGVRAMVFFLSNLPELSKFIQNCDEWTVKGSPENYVAHPKEDGYRSIHIVVDVPVLRKGKEDRMLCEIQLRTVLQHGWAGASHKLFYPPSDEISKFDLGRMFQIGEMLEGADIAIDDLRREIAKSIKDELR